MESRYIDEKSSVESHKMISAAEFNDAISDIFLKYGISRRSNFLLYLVIAFKVELTESQIDSIINGDQDCYFDEDLRKLRVPLLPWTNYKHLSSIFRRNVSLNFESGSKQEYSFDDITREQEYVYTDVDQIIEDLAANIEKGINELHPDILAKFRQASDNWILKDAIERVAAAFKPFDNACVTHRPPAGSDLDTVLLLVANMRLCFNALPDNHNCELTAEDLILRGEKFSELVNRLSPYAEPTHAFAQSNTEEFAWLLALKKAGLFYKENCATIRILNALLFQQQLADYLTAHAVKASEWDTIFGSVMAFGTRYENYSRADYYYKPTDPAYIYLSFHLLDESQCQPILEHLKAMDDKKEMPVFVVNKPENNYGFYELKVRSTDALNILLPKFKALFEKKWQENSKELAPYLGKVSPQLNRKCPIAFFDPKTTVANQSPQQSKLPRHRK